MDSDSEKSKQAGTKDFPQIVHSYKSSVSATLDFCQNIQLYLVKIHSKEFPDIEFQSWWRAWRQAFSLLFFKWQHSYKWHLVETVLSFRTLSWASIRFFTFIFLLEPRWTFKIPLYKSSVSFYFPLIRLILNIWFLYKEVTSSVCTSVAILTTAIRLFVKRLVFWFDDVSRSPWSRPTYLENQLVDWPMNIAMRAIEHVMRNYSYGNYPHHKCVVNHVEL